MNDHPFHDPDEIALGDMLASRALDADLAADEQRVADADDLIRERTAVMAEVQVWLRDVQVDPSVTATTVATALATDTGTGTGTEYIAPVVPLSRRRLPVWLGAAAAVAVVMAGAVVLTRGSGGDDQEIAFDAGNSTTSDAGATRMAPGDTLAIAVDPVTASAAPAGDGSDPAVGAPAGDEMAGDEIAGKETGSGVSGGDDGPASDPSSPREGSSVLPLSVVTVDLGDRDAATEPFPMPADDEIVHLDSAAELGWLGRWATPLPRSASRCRDGMPVLLPQALFGIGTESPVLVEVVLDTPVREVLALALDGCERLAAALLD